MRRIFFLFLLYALFPCVLFANSDLSIQLEHVPVNLHDTDSILRGGKLFVTQCMVCHTAKYLRYDKLAQQAGVLYDKMPLDDKRWILSTPPPDLSLEAHVRGPDWIYTYLNSFYQDPSKPSGSNNLLRPGTSMPNVLAALQGVQQLIPDSALPHSSSLFGQPHWYERLQLVSPGSMSPEEFNQSMVDIVNFLVYASEPNVLERRSLGYWVLGFLFIFGIFAYLLKKEYWKDIK